MANKFLFILSPDFSGSTLLHQLLTTSPHVSAIPGEGLFLPNIRPLLPDNYYEVEHTLPWEKIRQEWMSIWDLKKPILVEKSPPSIRYAEDMQRCFEPSWFVTLVRNPYAFCEGHNRRTGRGHGFAAKRWVTMAQLQARNVTALDRHLHLTYEELAGDPRAARDRLLEFVPELESLDVEREYNVQSINNAFKRGAPIENLNPVKIAQLSQGDIGEINAVLADHLELLQSFGYELIEPSTHSPAAMGDGGVSVAMVRTKYALKRNVRRLLRLVGLERIMPRKL